MANLQINRELIFTGSDLFRPRMAVEKEKMALFFPNFSFYGSGERVTSVKGYLSTSYYNKYYVRIEIGPNYPYSLPDIYLPYTTLEANCPHRFKNGGICVIKREQWSKTLSLAVLVAKAAVWVNKYDSWKQNGKWRWPGRGQKH